uniref:5'-Nucleotidase C-terminal domain-containing protein n=1 Tax=Chrysotila carterae TaxID=13221 RepID=A0A7S4BG94_CHRCT
MVNAASPLPAIGNGHAVSQGKHNKSISRNEQLTKEHSGGTRPPHPKSMNGTGPKSPSRLKKQMQIEQYLNQHAVDATLTAAIQDALRTDSPDPLRHIATYLMKGKGKDTSSNATQPAESKVGGRPAGAVGTFLRVLMVNDVYILDNFPNFATAVKEAKAAASALDCVAISTLNGDFLSPCIFTALDEGKTMLEGLNKAHVDYVCLGNHELDLPFETLAARLKDFKGVCINSNLRNPEVSHLPPYATVKVGERTALIGGFLTEDESIYAPTPKLNFVPVTEACLEVWERAKDDLGSTPDLFLPMTHQLISQDRQTAEALAKNDELKTRTPCLLAGHEHEMFVEAAGKSVVIKVGEDAERVGIIDIWWDASGAVKSAFKAVPASEFAPEPTALDYCKEKNDWLSNLMAAEIATLPSACSSKKVRHESSGLATFLLTMVKKGLRKDKVELVLLQGGGIRGSADYQAGPFTMGDLYKEFGFDTHMAVIPLKGQIIAESIFNSRSAPKPAPNFLHADDAAEIDDEHKIVKINGEPFDPERIYTVATYQFLLTGLNIIQPLLSYVQENVAVPTIDQCRPVKKVAMDYCVKETWRKLFDAEKWPTGEGATPTQDAISMRVAAAISAADSNNDGLLDEDEVPLRLAPASRFSLACFSHVPNA